MISLSAIDSTDRDVRRLTYVSAGIHDRLSHEEGQHLLQVEAALRGTLEDTSRLCYLSNLEVLRKPVGVIYRPLDQTPHFDLNGQREVLMIGVVGSAFRGPDLLRCEPQPSSLREGVCSLRDRETVVLRTERRSAD